jgi:hypothetical protein
LTSPLFFPILNLGKLNQEVTTMAKTKLTNKILNEKYIIVGHNVKGEILGHPILGMPAGKVMTRKEIYDVFLALAYYDCFEGCYGDVSCEEALKSDLKKGYFSKL